jgi:hypothetical protein
MGFDHELCRIPVRDLPEFLLGGLDMYPWPWLHIPWISGPNGFRITGGTIAAGSTKKQANPRHKGEWRLVAPSNQTKAVATEYLCCNGKMGCTPARGFLCAVRLKLSYYPDASCAILSEVESPTHGLNFKFKMSELRTPVALRDQIIGLGDQGMKPLAIQTHLMLLHPDEHNPSKVPPISVISDVLNRTRRAIRTGDV